MEVYKGTVFLIGTRWFAVLGPCRILIEKLLELNFRVFVIGAKDEVFEQFNNKNVDLIEVNFKRSYFSIFSDLKDLATLISLTIKYKPMFIHSFNPKPSIFASFISLFSEAKFFIGVTGLGNTFIENGIKSIILSKFMKLLYKNSDFIFFQNDDDINFFKENIVVEHEKIMKFPSPGVDINRFKINQDRRASKLKVITVSRLLWQKGLDDFCNTVSEIRARDLIDRFEFTVVGPRDYQHPDRLRKKDIDQMLSLGIKWVDWTAEIEKFYQENHVLLFMSHREGAPRAILEASAVGLPTIGARTIGVKDLIKDNLTGYHIELHDIDSIINRLMIYFEDDELRIQHGRNARREIAEPLSLENATAAQLRMYFPIEDELKSKRK